MNFAKFFSKERDNATVVKPFQQYESFPFDSDYKIKQDSYYLLCFISFYCHDCIELLPHLNKLNDITGKFILFTNGTEEENVDLRTHFQFTFPIYTYQHEELIHKYRVALTPYAYMLDSSRQVLVQSVVETVDEIRAFIENSKNIDVVQER